MHAACLNAQSTWVSLKSFASKRSLSCMEADWSVASPGWASLRSVGMQLWRSVPGQTGISGAANGPFCWKNMNDKWLMCRESVALAIPPSALVSVVRWGASLLWITLGLTINRMDRVNRKHPTVNWLWLQKGMGEWVTQWHPWNNRSGCPSPLWLSFSISGTELLNLLCWALQAWIQVMGLNIFKEFLGAV